MCTSGQGNHVHRALCHFRFFVYREYREIRHLNGDNGQYGKFVSKYENLKALQRPEFAKLYDSVGVELDTTAILWPFEQKTGLDLEDLAEAFNQGTWKPNFGGKKHADIVESTRLLRDAIQSNSNDIDLIVSQLREKNHNTGPAIDDYHQLLDDLKSSGINIDLYSNCCVSPDAPAHA